MLEYQETTLGSHQRLLHQKFQILLWSGKDYSYSPNDPCTCEARHIFPAMVFVLRADLANHRKLFLFRSETNKIISGTHVPVFLPFLCIPLLFPTFVSV